MARRYKVTFEKVSISAVQDLFFILRAAGKMLRLIRVALFDVDPTAPTNQTLALRIRFLPATVTNGSGGTAPTPQKVDPGDAAASFTARVNDTTKASSSGTAVVVEEAGCNVFGGYDYMLPTPLPIGPSEAAVFELITAPTGTLIMNGTVEVEEIGG